MLSWIYAELKTLLRVYILYYEIIWNLTHDIIERRSDLSSDDFLSQNHNLYPRIQTDFEILTRSNNEFSAYQFCRALSHSFFLCWSDKLNEERLSSWRDKIISLIYTSVDNIMDDLDNNCMRRFAFINRIMWMIKTVCWIKMEFCTE